MTGSWAYPGYHPDDWESYQVRIDAAGRVRARASSHHGYQWCKESECENRWGRASGWSRVSRGSHAGHLPLGDGGEPHYPGVHLRERTTTGAGLRLVPIESVDRDAYRALDPGITPPWEKEVFENPRSNSTG